MWNTVRFSVYSDVNLHFVNWDCYVSDPNHTLDVFVFDGIYLSSFVREGYLLLIPRERIPFALDGCISGENFYALPQMLCADFLYTRKDYAELSKMSNIMNLYEIIGDRKTEFVIPEENETVMGHKTPSLFCCLFHKHI